MDTLSDGTHCSDIAVPWYLSSLELTQATPVLLMKSGGALLNRCGCNWFLSEMLLLFYIKLSITAKGEAFLV